jgi:hypothetical protein
LLGLSGTECRVWAGWDATVYFFVKVSTTSSTNFATARLSLRGTWHSSLAVEPPLSLAPGLLEIGGLGLFVEVTPPPENTINGTRCC